jgi:hypothetical protein
LSIIAEHIVRIILTIEVLVTSRKANVESYIRYQTKATNVKQYATFCPFDRRHGGKDTYLGIVIDETEGIFYNRNSGYFRFTIKGGKRALNPDEASASNLRAIMPICRLENN